jgi:hypothetical protein
VELSFERTAGSGVQYAEKVKNKACSRGQARVPPPPNTASHRIGHRDDPNERRNRERTAPRIRAENHDCATGSGVSK